MTEERYNYIFSELVNDEDDILGQLAYSVYKRQKIEYIHAFKERNGTDPLDCDLAAFHDISNSSSQLEAYRTQATRLATNFLESSLSTETDELAAFYSSRAANEIRMARPGFWKGAAQSLVGSGLFTLLVGCLVFFAWSLKQGPRQVIEQVFDVVIVDADSRGRKMQPDTPQS